MTTFSFPLYSVSVWRLTVGHQVRIPRCCPKQSHRQDANSGQIFAVRSLLPPRPSRASANKGRAHRITYDVTTRLPDVI